MGLSEAELVQRLLQERVRLLAYIWTIVRDSHLAEDIFQEVSLLAVRKRSEISQPAALLSWLRKAARLHAFSTMRKINRTETLLSNEVLDSLDLAWDKLSGESTTDLADALQHCMKRLSPRSQQIIGLRYQHKLSGDGVADRMNMKVNSLYVALGRIHKALHDCVQRVLAEKGISHE